MLDSGWWATKFTWRSTAAMPARSRSINEASAASYHCDAVFLPRCGQHHVCFADENTIAANNCAALWHAALCHTSEKRPTTHARCICHANVNFTAGFFVNLKIVDSTQASLASCCGNDDPLLKLQFLLSSSMLHRYFWCPGHYNYFK